MSRERHVPQPKAQHIYWSRRADGTKVFEVRHPRNADGKRPYEVVGPRLDQAKARAKEIHGTDAPRVTNVGLTLNDVIKSWQETRQLRPRSVESADRIIRLHIQPRFGRTKVRDITRQALMIWLANLKRVDGKERPLEEGTKHLVWAVMRGLLGHAVELGALGGVPKLKRVPRQSAPRRRVLSPDEEARLLAYSAAFPWLKPVIVVALYQGLRLGEVLGLQWESVDFPNGTITIRHSLGRDGTLGPTKGGKARTIELLPVARQELLELRMDSAGEGFVFRGKTGKARDHRNIQRAFATTRQRAGLKVHPEDGPVVFHSLRHTAISRLANHPAIPLVHVRDFAGHTDLAVTQGYVHRIDSEKVRTAMAEALGG